MNMDSCDFCTYPKNECACNKMNELSSLFKIVAEKNRLKLMCLLRQQELCVSALQPIVKLEQSLISHHLADLREANLVVDKKHGQRIYYRLTKFGDQLMKLFFEIDLTT